MYRREVQFQLFDSPEEVVEFVNKTKGTDLVTVIFNGHQYCAFFYRRYVYHEDPAGTGDYHLPWGD